MEEEVKEAYEVMKRIDVLDVSVGTPTSFLERALLLKKLQRELRFGSPPRTHITSV